jgi:3-oxoacyl-(acyl-carrier-protein) synthase
MKQQCEKQNGVIVTGFGLISALGLGESQTVVSLKNKVRNCSDTPDWLQSNFGKKVFLADESNFEQENDKSRTLNLAFAALKQALEMSNLSSRMQNLRVGVCMGTTVSSQLNDVEFYKEFKKQEINDFEPVHRYLSSNLAEAIADVYNFNGPNLSVVNACSSGTDAIGIGKSWIDNDMCDVVIAGGADEINRVPLSGFHSLSVYSDDVCKPFDANRTGLNLGEGAGVLVLEKANAEIKSYGSVLGYGTAVDAYHLTAPRPDGQGLKKAIEFALKQANIDSTDIAMINAHGTSTKNNDICEGSTLADLFGSAVNVVSTKGYTGHTLGAAGALEAIFCLLSLKENFVPANVGLDNLDENIKLNVRNEEARMLGDYALSTSLAFGGNNSALIIGR